MNAKASAAPHCHATLTLRQLAVVRFIASRMDEGIGASCQEIADALGVGKVTAFEHVQALRRKGLVAEASGGTRLSRSYTLLAWRCVPLSKLEAAFDGLTGTLTVDDVRMRLRAAATAYALPGGEP